MNDQAKLLDSQILCWPKRLLSADDLRRHLTSQREVMLPPKAIITPLAVDELRAKGVRVTWSLPKAKDGEAAKTGAWFYAVEKPDALIASVVKALERDGVTLVSFDAAGPTTTWARSVGEAILRANHVGGVAICNDAGLVCCVANKLSGIRAAAVFSVAQVQRAKASLAANLFAVETSGRTFFELKQMLRTIATSSGECPAAVAETLQELDGHAHR